MTATSITQARRALGVTLRRLDPAAAERVRAEHARVQRTEELAAIAAASAQIDMFAGLDLGDAS